MATQTTRGRRAMRPPSRAHRPVAVGSAVPCLGRTGQNSHRPKITSSAGQQREHGEQADHDADRGDRAEALVEFSSARVRTSMPIATVAALAMIAGPARCSASAIASCRSSWRRSSSR